VPIGIESVEAKVENVGIKDIKGSRINPAKEDGVLSIIRNLVLAIVNPPYLDKTLNRVRGTEIIESGTVTTVTTVTTLTNFGTQTADVTYRINNINAWANNVRNLLT